MDFRVALNTDLPQIEAILSDQGLPYSDCGEHIEHFLVLIDNESIVGVGGLEYYGDIALLRSIAILHNHQKQGLGHSMYLQLKANARELGVKFLYLLTETADDYFSRHGFVEVDRSVVPEKIKTTKQFSGLCSESAVVMSIAL